MVDQTDPTKVKDHEDFDTPTSLVETLVGEGKKFKTVDDLAIGKIESDVFIQKLLKEKRELEEKLEEAANMKDLMEALKASTGERTDAPKKEEEFEVASREERNPPPESNPEDIRKTVEQLLEERLKKEKAAERLKFVAEKLEESLGSKEEALSRLSSLGLSNEALNTLALENPEALLKLVGAKEEKGTLEKETAPVGDFETGSKTDMSSQKEIDPNILNDERAREGLTESWFQRLRDENPSLYRSPKVQAIRHELAIKKGAAFFEE